MIKMNHWDLVVHFKRESVFTGQVKEPFSHWLYKDWRPFPNTCLQTVTDWWRFPNWHFQLLPYPQRIYTVCLIWQILYMNCFSWYNPKVHYVSFCAWGWTKDLCRQMCYLPITANLLPTLCKPSSWVIYHHWYNILKLRVSCQTSALSVFPT